MMENKKMRAEHPKKELAVEILRLEEFQVLH